MLLDKLVIGSSPLAVKYANSHNLPIIINSNSSPMFYEETLSQWSSDLFEISLRGQALFGSEVKTVRIVENVASVTHATFRTDIEFNKCFIFDDQNLFLENELLKSEKLKSKVVDWVSVRSCAEHFTDNIFIDSDFVKEVYFYKSDRISGNHNKRDAVCISYLTKEELKDFDFSDTMVRFKLEKLMLDNGISGTSRGIDKNTKKSYPRKIKLEVSEREVYHRIVNSYKESEFIVFM